MKIINNILVFKDYTIVTLTKVEGSLETGVVDGALKVLEARDDYVVTFNQTIDVKSFTPHVELKESNHSSAG